jgi:hypothetical protein
MIIKNGQSYLHSQIDPLAIPVLSTSNCYHSLSAAKYTSSAESWLKMPVTSVLPTIPLYDIVISILDAYNSVMILLFCSLLVHTFNVVNRLQVILTEVLMMMVFTVIYKVCYSMNRHTRATSS